MALLEISHKAPSVSEHLVNWQMGKGGFWTLNLDTFIVSLLIGFLFIAIFYRVAKNAQSGVPGKLQNLIELVIDFVDNLVREAYPSKSKFIPSLALTIFIWILLLSAMDLMPDAILLAGLKLLGIEHFKLVSTTDPNLTFALSFSVFGCILFYNISSKGFINLVKEIYGYPFTPKWLMFPINIFFRMLEEIVKPLSLSLRLYGNMFAGEMIFILISLLPWFMQWPFGVMWSLFHILIVLIQAFVFMMLTIIYLSMAVKSHN